MNVQPSRQPLIRISKTGEMRLRNKIGDAILKDNAHEERALDSQLVFIKKHQARQDKYLTYKQIDFASKQIAATEERPKTISAVMARNDTVLPQIQSINLNNSMKRGRTSTMAARKSNLDLDRSQNSGDFRPQRTSKESWEKAMALIRVSLQNRQTTDAPRKQNQTFFTHVQLENPKEGKRKTRKEKMDGSTSKTLPPLPQSRDSQRSRHRRGRLLSRKPSFPEMIKLSREKSMSGLQDPRFLELESCLGGGRNSFFGRGNSLRDPSSRKSNSFRKRKITTFL